MKKILKKGGRIKGKDRAWLNRELLSREYAGESRLAMIQMQV